MLSHQRIKTERKLAGRAARLLIIAIVFVHSYCPSHRQSSRAYPSFVGRQPLQYRSISATT